MKYEITLATDEQEYSTVVETPPMSLADMTTSPGRLIESALERLNNEGANINRMDVINASVRELDDYEEYLYNEGKINE
jgi:hypothetical protein